MIFSFFPYFFVSGGTAALKYTYQNKQIKLFEGLFSLQVGPTGWLCIICTDQTSGARGLKISTFTPHD